MRLLRLRLAGFGAYVDELCLEFRDLPSDALFLIHGPTGGGKTTILDAICYALFGETSTGERDGAHLRSDHAGPDDPTFAELDFAVRGEAYRVRRSPEYQRPKQRGEGTLRQAATATLMKLAGSEPGAAETAQLASRAREVTARASQILGTDAQQFRQIALLPQGLFREMLLADSKERERIMAGLFGTEALARFQQHLRARAKALADDIRDGRSRRQILLEQLRVADEAGLAEEQAVQAGRLGELTKGVEAARAAEAAVRAQVELLRASNLKLDQLAAAQGTMRLVEAGAEAQLERQARLEAAGRAQAVEPVLRELERARRDYANARTSRQDAAGQVEKAEQAVAIAEERWQRQLGLGLGLAARLATEVQRRERATLEARAELARLEQAWRAGRAAQLAAGLAAGSPCPVCGSAHHPAPAAATPDLPDDDAVDAARRMLEGLEREANDVARRLAAFQATLQRLGPGPDVEPITPDPRLGPERYEAELRQLEEQRRQAAERLALARQQLAGAIEREQAAQECGETARSEVDRSFVDAGFSDIEALTRARLDAAAVEALRQAVQRFERQRIEAMTRLADAEAAAAGIERQDPAPLEAALAERTSAREQAVRAEQSCRDRQAELARGAATLGELGGRLEALERRYGIIGRLADIANGEGGAARITFQRFVLAALLDEALDAASQRLSLMSRGRYLLRRVREAADRRVSAGLDLEVDDAYTGRARPVATLSGGESFMAALALALGMADVVSRHAGGVRLEVMFIDEGFGSLDPEALDLALRTLIDLRRQGRMIGVISHVPELKERIDCRLEVKASTRGSTAAFALP